MTSPLVVRHIVLLGVAVTALVSGCRDSTLATGVSDSTFVAVMAELKRAKDAPGLDSAGRDARRRAILQGRGLTPAQLESAAVQLAKNPTRAQAVWQAIERRALDTASKKPPVDTARKPPTLDTTNKQPAAPADSATKQVAPAIDTSAKPAVVPADTANKPANPDTSKKPTVAADTAKKPS